MNKRTLLIVGSSFWPSLPLRPVTVISPSSTRRAGRREWRARGSLLRRPHESLVPVARARHRALRDGARAGLCRRRGWRSSPEGRHQRPRRPAAAHRSDHGTAVHATVPHELRLLGTVEVDETRLYDISSITEGWIREITDATTGSFVRKSQVLAKYYSQDAYNPQQSFIYALNNMDRQSGPASARPIRARRSRRTSSTPSRRCSTWA